MLHVVDSPCCFLVLLPSCVLQVIAISGILTPDTLAPTFTGVGGDSSSNGSGTGTVLQLGSRQFTLRLPVAVDKPADVSYAMYRWGACRPAKRFLLMACANYAMYNSAKYEQVGFAFHLDRSRRCMYTAFCVRFVALPCTAALLSPAPPNPPCGQELALHV